MARELDTPPNSSPAGYRRRQELEALRQARLPLLAGLELEPVMEAILEAALKLVAAKDAHIFLYDGDRLTFAAAAWADGRRGVPFAQPREQGLTYTVARSGQWIVIPDVDSHPLYEGFRWGGAIVGIPLSLHDEVKGVMTVAFEKPRAFDEDELRLLGLLADQAVIAVQNAQLFGAERRRRREAETLWEATAALTSSLELPQVLNTILDHLAKVVSYDSASVLLLEGESLCLVAGRGFPEPERVVGFSFPAANALFQVVYQTRQPYFLPDTYLDDRFERWGRFAYIRAWMGVPLIVRDEVIGCLTLDSRQVGAFGEAEAALAQGFANQAAVAIHNAQLFQETQSQAHYATLLNEITYAATATVDLQAMLQILADRLGELLDADGCYIALWDETHQRAIPAAAYGPRRDSYPQLRAQPGEVTATASVLAAGRPLVIEDVFHSPYISPRIAALFSDHSLLALPLIAGEQKLGAALIAFNQSHHFTAEEVARGEQAARQISLAVHRAQALEMLEQRVQERTRELTEAYEQLQELDRLKTKFISDMTHELRTPISNLDLYLNLLERGRPEKHAQYRQILRQEAARLINLLSTTLDLEHLKVETGDVRREMVNLNDVVEQVVAIQRPRAEAAGLALSFAPGAALPPLTAEPNQLATVVTNLLANAISYTPAGTVAVRTGVGDGGRQVFVEVADSGPGIDPADEPHLFERFYRGRHASQSNIPGPGLGLTIVKQIVDAHGGRIEVENRGGAVFRAWLPAAGSGE
ncbi:MAG: GAF domain-containing protein [Chloroflexota bacterium]